MAYHSIEHTERRWAWFKRLLKTVEFKFAAIWPAHWEVSKKLCAAFVEISRDHTLSMLTLMESEEQPDVSVLLKALQTTLRFEQEMDARFRSKGTENASTLKEEKRGGNPFADDADTGGNKMEGEEVEEGRTSGDKKETRREEENAFGIKDRISGEYDRFLGPYVILERQNLDEVQYHPIFFVFCGFFALMRCFQVYGTFYFARLLSRSICRCWRSSRWKRTSSRRAFRRRTTPR